MGGMSLFHWVIIILIVLVVFGPSRLPNLGKSLGQAIRGFKKGLDESMDNIENDSTSRTQAEKLQAGDSAAKSDVKSEVKKSEKEEV
ncbi:MAG: twin-arginine translocase TatA/TatE family subunit [Bdellovibrionales bacterium]|nr:twin-arginine translocase TatA/TatE family subunit [Bdellovibrionales bacterium]